MRQRLPWGSGSWNVSWDTSRQTSNNPLTSFDPALQSGFQFALSQPLLKDRKMDLARQQTIVARRNLESAELRVRESVVQTTAAVKQAYWTLKATLANVDCCSSDRSSWRRSSCARTKRASMSARRRRSIFSRPRPRWRSAARI